MTPITLKRLSDRPTHWLYWAIAATSFQEAAALFSTRFPAYAPPVYQYQSTFYFAMDWRRG
jgi:hypothetical protein